MRKIAYYTIWQVINEDKHSNRLINKYMEKIENFNDQKLYTNIVYGSIANYLYFDKIIDQLSTTKIKPKVKCLIIMSMYQIKFLDKVPAYAVINEAVNIAKSEFNTTNAKIVNAVLRRYAENPDEVSFDEEWINYSTPEWLFKLLKAQYPMQYSIILDQLATKPAAIARINQNIDFPLDEFDEVYENYAIKYAGNIANTDAFKNGKVTIQDLSSIETILEAPLKPNSKILDACAAPGTKSTLIAEKLNNQCELYINDINDKKQQKIIDNFERTHTKYEKMTFVPAQELVNLYPTKYFDCILLDVPCSGIGVIKRKPEIKYNIKPENLDDLLKIQAEILTNCLSLLSDDGFIIYSTCTLNKNENLKQLQKLNLEIIEEKTILPDAFHDGFFHAIVKKGK